jgi:hypothetical protein
MHFMVKTGADKFNPEDRKIIRSHVMKGKNLGKIRPPRRRRDLDWDDLRQNVLSSSPSPSDSDTSSPTKGRDKSSSQRASSSTTPISECYPVILSPASIPRKFGSVASAICFADLVKPATVDVVLQCESLPTQFNALHPSPSRHDDSTNPQHALSLLHRQAAPLPLGDLHILRAASRKLDCALSHRPSLPPRQDLHIAILFRRDPAAAILPCKPTHMVSPPQSAKPASRAALGRQRRCPAVEQHRIRSARPCRPRLLDWRREVG